MDKNELYRDIARRTNGEIYIGVVGPVRTGKSTFIKRFMDVMVIPSIQDENVRARLTDEPAPECRRKDHNDYPTPLHTQ